MKKNHTPHSTLPPLDNLPSQSDESISNTLDFLLALIDDYEQRYAAPLRRVRVNRFHELHEPWNRDQLPLPLLDGDDEPV